MKFPLTYCQINSCHFWLAKFHLQVQHINSFYFTVVRILCMFLFLLQRLQYAKHFCYLTSSRRAKNMICHTSGLNKVRNIKTWLSLRSYLKKRGPQRSVDTIVSAAFFLAVILVSIMCIEVSEKGLLESHKFLMSTMGCIMTICNGVFVNLSSVIAKYKW